MALFAQEGSPLVSENSLGSVRRPNWLFWLPEAGNQNNQKAIWEESQPEPIQLAGQMRWTWILGRSGVATCSVAQPR
jgi:hypothetical protein